MVHLDYKYVFSAAGEGRMVGQYLELCRPLQTGVMKKWSELDQC